MSEDKPGGPSYYLEAVVAFAGNFRLESELARDATCVTYVGVHRVLPRRALVKIMSDVGSTAESFVAVQLLREACLMTALDHPGVPRVYEAGLLGKRPWFAIELVAAPSLAELVTLGTIDRRQALLVVRDLAEVLDHAHGHGVVHAGLRPDFVALAARSQGFQLCVTDWATARAHDAAPIPYAPTLESWHYTAPEIVRGEVASDRADTYSLGVIAHLLLAGAPYTREGVSNLDISTVPPDLVALVDEMVVENAAERPGCAEVHDRAVKLIDALELPSSFRIRKPRWTPDAVYQRPASEPEIVIVADDDQGD